MRSRTSVVAALVMAVVALAGCSSDEPIKPVASKACGLISDQALREITGDRELYERSEGYRYYEPDPDGYVRPQDATVRCTASAPAKDDRPGDSYAYIAATNLNQVRTIRRELNMVEPDDTESSVRRQIRRMRRDRTCSRLVILPKYAGYICDEKAGRRLTNAFVVPNDRREVTFFFYSSIDQSVATPENVLRWAKDVDRTIAERDKIAAEEAKNDSKD